MTAQQFDLEAYAQTHIWGLIAVTAVGTVVGIVQTWLLARYVRPSHHNGYVPEPATAWGVMMVCCILTTGTLVALAVALGAPFAVASFWGAVALILLLLFCLAGLAHHVRTDRRVRQQDIDRRLSGDPHEEQ